MVLPAAQVYAAGEGIVSKEEELGVFTTHYPLWASGTLQGTL